MSKLVLTEQSVAPTTPSSGKLSIYAKTDGKAYAKNDAGVEYDLTDGGEDLAATLVLGNATGGTDIVLTDGDKVTGESGAGVAGNVALLGGTSSGAGDQDGGSIILRPGLQTGTGAVGVIEFSSPSGGNEVQAFVPESVLVYPDPVLLSPSGGGSLGMTLGPLVQLTLSHTFSTIGEIFQVPNHTSCVFVTSTLANCAIELPVSPVIGQTVTIKDITTLPDVRTTFNITPPAGTIDGNGGGTTVGPASFLSYTCVWDGTNWYII